MIEYFVEDTRQKMLEPLYKLLLEVSKRISWSKKRIVELISIDSIGTLFEYFMIIAIVLFFNAIFFIIMWRLINKIATLASGRLDLTMEFAYEYENEYLERIIGEKINTEAKIEGKIKGNDLKKVNDKKSYY